MVKRVDRALSVDGKGLDAIRLGEVARLVEVSERNYGEHSDSIDDGRAFGRRLSWLAEVHREMMARGLDTGESQRKQDRFPEAKDVDDAKAQ